MSGTRVPRGVVLTAVLCALVVAAALGTAALLRDRAAARPAAETSVPAATDPEPTDAVGSDGCRPGQECRLLGSATLGSTQLDLIGDPGGLTGRLRIGGPGISQVIEVTVTQPGVALGTNSLFCLGSLISGCLVRGTGEGGAVGQVVVGRSGKWNLADRSFFSAAGSLSLTNVTGDTTPEVIAAQCDKTCSRVYLQAFDLAGEEQGCTRTYAKVEQLPGYPEVTVTKAALTTCP